MPSIDARFRGIRLVRPLSFSRYCETWLARWRGRGVVAKLYDVRGKEECFIPQEPLLADLIHPLAPRFLWAFDTFDDDRQWRVHVFSWVEGRDLRELSNRSALANPELVVVVVAYGLATYLSFLHERWKHAPRLHGDLSLSNVLLCVSGRIKVLDALLLLPGRFPLPDRRYVAKRSFAAPELLRGMPPTTATDVFAGAKVVQLLSSSTDMDVASVLGQVWTEGLAMDPAQRPHARHLWEAARLCLRRLVPVRNPSSAVLPVSSRTVS